jgi:hypothetical protein
VAPNGRIAAIDDGDGHLWWWDLDRARQKFGSEPDDACAVEGVRFSRNSRLALINQFDGHILRILPPADLLPPTVARPSGTRGGVDH